MFWRKKKTQNGRQQACCNSGPQPVQTITARVKAEEVGTSCCAAPVTPVVKNRISEDMVALRAFEIWQREGQPQGRDLDHWFSAQHELLLQ